jgi:hypothetical protein
MPTKTNDELREFHRFLTDKLTTNGTELSPEEALDQWRQLHPCSNTMENDIAAIKDALDDIAKGEQGMSFDEFDREFRARHNIPG